MAKAARQIRAIRSRAAAVYVELDEQANGPYKGSAAERSHRGKPPGRDPWRNKTGRGRKRT
jgi:hypothetical protein